MKVTKDANASDASSHWLITTERRFEGAIIHQIADRRFQKVGSSWRTDHPRVWKSCQTLSGRPENLSCALLLPSHRRVKLTNGRVETEVQRQPGRLETAVNGKKTPSSYARYLDGPVPSSCSRSLSPPDPLYFESTSLPLCLLTRHLDRGSSGREFGVAGSYKQHGIPFCGC